MVRSHPHRSRARVVAVLAVLAAALAAPAAARAAVLTLGSDLSHDANLVEAHGADSAFWLTSLGNGGTVRIPDYGQVTALKLKGTALPSQQPSAPAPLTEFHFQVLQPGAGNSVTVRETSEPFNVPAGGDPQQVTTYRPGKLCVQPGDYIAFNDEGGYDPRFYPAGVPFQLFSSITGSTTNFFSQDNGTNTGTTFTGAPHGNEELLLQVELATGGDIPKLCPAAAKATFGGVTISPQLAPVLLKQRITRVRMSCPAGTYALCSGRLTLTTAKPVKISKKKKKRKKRKRKKARVQTIGAANVNIGPGNTVNLRVPVGSKALRLFRNRKTVSVTARAVVHDGFGQSQTNTAAIKLKGVNK